jgi:uncharacterized membrane protein YphA (DoxX/SURF4 family)
MSIIVLWFGIQQLMNPAQWTIFLPSWAGSLPISAVTFVLLNGWVECTFGLLLIAGFYTRIIALLLALHLYGIAFTLGYNAIGVRDFGLSTALLSVFFYGPDTWSLDRKFLKKNPEQTG